MEFYQFFLGEYFLKHGERDASNVYNYAFNDTLVKKDRPYYRYSDIFPLQEISFEGHSFYGPNDIQRYLTILYGANYLSPPPKSQHVLNVFQYIKNTLPKDRILKWMEIFFERDKKHFIARRSKTVIGRLYFKLLSFCSFIWSCLMNKEYRFILIYLKYSFIQAK